MSAAEALRLARENGVRVGVSGADLILDAEREPAPGVLEAIKRHKAAIVALLGVDNDAWTGEGWRAFFDERAAIAEFDGGLSRPEAEALAFSECMHQWLRQNEPIEVLPSSAQDASRCRLCGDDITSRSDVIVTICGRRWHIGCHERWLAERYGRATEGLRGMGIELQHAVGSPTEAV